MRVNILRSIKPYIAKYEPELLMAMGISGMIFSTVWGIRSTIKASELIRKTQKEINDIANENKEPAHQLTRQEKLKLVWKLYLPVAISMAVSVPCIIAGNRVSNGRNMALAAAYTLSETALQDYKEKTKEISGDKVYEKINESISKDKVQAMHQGSKVTLIGDGDSLFFEPLSGRFFKSNWNRISKSANELNARALGNVTGVITIGEWYNILGLDSTALDDVLGWTIADGTKGIIDISIDSVLTPDDQPCGAIRYNTVPNKI